VPAITRVALHHGDVFAFERAADPLNGARINPEPSRDLAHALLAPRLMRGGRKTLKGYWRHPMVVLPIVREEPAAEVARAEREDSLAPELERLTRLALEKMTQILRIPTDRGDGNLLRAQTAAAGLAVNAQLRADETRMKQVHRTDVMERILVMLREEKAKLEEERLEREGK
jgi:hypothetical protein